MSHGITTSDTMFSVGVTPWHRLGTVLNNPPTLDEAIRLAGLDWTVRLEPIHAMIGGRPVRAPGSAVVRDDSNKILGTVGPSWEPLQNAKAFAWFAPWLETGQVSLETAGSLHGGKRVWILAKLLTDPIVVKGDDVVEKYLLLAHAHDGTLAIRLGLTPIRVVCANTLGLALARGNAEQRESNGERGLFKIKHRAGAADALVNAREQLAKIDERLSAQADVYRMLAAAPVRGGEATLVEFLGAVYRKPAKEIRTSRRLEQITELFETGVGQDLEAANGTYWGLVNALAEHVTHHKGKSAENRLGGMAFGEGANELRRGIDVALAMATRTFTVGEVFGELSDANVAAIAHHPDALVA